MTDYIAVQVEGSKNLEFLQGQLSQSVLNIAQDRCVKSLFCSTKGRILALLNVIFFNDAIYLVLPKLVWPKIEGILSKVALLSKVKLNVTSDIPIYKDETQTYLALESDFECISYDAWKSKQMSQKQFELYPETSGVFLAHDLGLEQDAWIDFKKGCFRGQEIIARMHYLSESKYYLEKFELDSASHHQVGDIIYQDDSENFLAQVVDKHEHPPRLLCLIKKNCDKSKIDAKIKI